MSVCLAKGVFQRKPHGRQKPIRTSGLRTTTFCGTKRGGRGNLCEAVFGSAVSGFHCSKAISLVLGQDEEAGACWSHRVGTAGEPPSLPTVPFLLASRLASLDASPRTGAGVPSQEGCFPRQVSNVCGVS